MRNTRSISAALAAAVSLLATFPSHAAGIVVNTTADGAPVANGNLTVREALTAANTNSASGDASAGDAGSDFITFTVSGTITLDPVQGQLVISEALLLNGVAIGAAIEVDGGGVMRILDLTTTKSVLINNIDFSNRNAGVETDGSSDGGAIRIVGGADSTVANSAFSGNAAFSGGAIDVNPGGNVLVPTNDFSNNQAIRAGGGIGEQYRRHHRRQLQFFNESWKRIVDSELLMQG